MEELLQAVKRAIRQTVAAVRAEHPQETLAGYALLTDDDLMSLLYLAITKEALAASDDDDLLFTPTDWPYEPAAASFDAASEQLGELAEAAEDDAHVHAAFATLVQAVAESRAEGVFAPEVFVTVLSTDPGPLLEQLERSAVRALNQAELVQAHGRFIAKWGTV